MKTFWMVGGIAVAMALRAFGSGTDSGEVLETYVERGMTARYLVPTDGSVDAVWTDPDFDDAAWAEGQIGMGFDSGWYLPYILTDLRGEMLSQGSGIYIRVEFNIEDLPEVGTPAFCARLDDALVAYLNGVEIVRTDLAPQETNWESRSIGNISETGFEAGEEFYSDSWRPLLQPGKNVLALHGLNSRPTNGDFLIDPTFQIQQIPPKFTKVADHPLVGTFGIRGLLGMKAFAGRIYMGCGEWNDHPGPTVLYSYDPSDGVVRAEHSINSDSIEQMVVVDDKLWIPSIDPIHFNRFTDLSILHADGHLEQRTPVGFYHVFDVLERMNGDVLLVGSKDGNEWPRSGGAIFSSGDRGQTWEEFDPGQSASRFYAAREDLSGELLLDTSSTHVERALVRHPNGDVRVEVHGNTFRRRHSDLSEAVRGCEDLAVEGSRVYLLNGSVVEVCDDITASDPQWETLATNAPSSGSFLEVIDGALFVGTSSSELWARPIAEGAPFLEATYENVLPEGCGTALAMDGNTLAVGAPTASGAFVQSGKVYLFERSSADAEWQETAVLTAPVENIGGLFGDSVALEGDTMAVLESGIFFDSDRGEASVIHIYERDNDGVFQHVSSQTEAYAQSVALGGGHLFWGGLSALIGERVADGQRVEYNSLGNVGYEPYSHVAMAPKADGTWIVAQGASGDLSRDGSPGAAYVGSLTPDPASFSPTFVVNSNTGPFERFGFSVTAAEGLAAEELVAVGAPRSDFAGAQAGVAQIFHKPDGEIFFRLDAEIVAPFAEPEDDFGHSVALSPGGHRLLVGAPFASGPGGRRGAVFLFEEVADEWEFRNVYFPPTDAPGRWEYGTKVIFDGDTGIVGSRFADDGLPALERVDFIDLSALPLTSYGLWTISRGLSAPDDAPDADPEGDGTSNLAHFAFDLPTGEPTIVVEEDQAKVVMHTRADADAAGLTYRVEVSAELGEWTELLATDPNPQRVGGWERSELALPNGVRFVRGLVELAP